jgi:hypothetical protein
VIGSFVFVAAREPAKTEAESTETAFWEAMSSTDAPELLNAYLRLYPSGRFAPIATFKLNRLRER